MLNFIVILLALFLYIDSSPICDYFYYCEGGIQCNEWWILRMILITLNFIPILYIAMNKPSAWCIFVIEVFLGFCVSDFIDRLFFDVNTFRINDIIGIELVLLAVSIQYYKKYVR